MVSQIVPCVDSTGGSIAHFAAAGGISLTIAESSVLAGRRIRKRGRRRTTAAAMPWSGFGRCVYHISRLVLC